MIPQFLNSAPVIAFFDWLQTRGLTIAIIVFVAWLGYHLTGFIVTRFVHHLIRSTRFNQMSELDVKKRQDTLSGLLTTVVRIFILIIATFTIFKQLLPHVNYAPLFASAGIIGVALGFGAQSLIKDFLTGIFIITENQYRVGDVVDIAGAAGTVEHVGIRSTIIRDVDGNVHYLPNGTVSHVINKTMGFSKVNLTLSVDPDTDIALLSSVINATGEKLAADPAYKAKITEAPHFLFIGNVSQFGIEAIIVGTTLPSEQWVVSAEMRRRLIAAFRRAKIHLAAPIVPMPWTPPKK